MENGTRRRCRQGNFAHSGLFIALATKKWSQKNGNFANSGHQRDSIRLEGSRCKLEDHPFSMWVRRIATFPKLFEKMVFIHAKEHSGSRVHPIDLERNPVRIRRQIQISRKNLQ